MLTPYVKCRFCHDVKPDKSQGERKSGEILLLSRRGRNYNESSMPRILTLFILASAIFATGQSSSELPSAPSAVLKQRNQASQTSQTAQPSEQQANTAGQSSTSTAGA